MTNDILTPHMHLTDYSLSSAVCKRFCTPNTRTVVEEQVTCPGCIEVLAERVERRMAIPGLCEDCRQGVTFPSECPSCQARDIVRYALDGLL